MMDARVEIEREIAKVEYTTELHERLAKLAK
jgi:hypothetical protein